MATQVRPIAHSSSSNDSYQPQFSRTSSVPPQGSAPAAHDEFPSKPKHDRASFPDARGVDNLEKASPSRDMKTATLNIAEHSQTELLAMLSALLTKITTSNDKLHTRSDAPNPSTHGTPYLAFHAQNVPVISIHSYLTRILKYCPMSSDIFLSLLVYFDRMSKNPLSDQSDHGSRQMFTSTRLYLGDEHHPFAIDSYNIHRLVITAIVVASKFCSDVFYTNSRYAKVGGLPLSELNHLESQFLLLNDFRLMIPMEELQRYGDQLLAFWQNEQAIEQSRTSKQSSPKGTRLDMSL